MLKHNFNDRTNIWYCKVTKAEERGRERERETQKSEKYNEIIKKIAFYVMLYVPSYELSDIVKCVELVCSAPHKHHHERFLWLFSEAELPWNCGCIKKQPSKHGKTEISIVFFTLI